MSHPPITTVDWQTYDGGVRFGGRPIPYHATVDSICDGIAGNVSSEFKSGLAITRRCLVTQDVSVESLPGIRWTAIAWLSGKVRYAWDRFDGALTYTVVKLVDERGNILSVCSRAALSDLRTIFRARGVPKKSNPLQLEFTRQSDEYDVLCYRVTCE